MGRQLDEGGDRVFRRVEVTRHGRDPANAQIEHMAHRHPAIVAPHLVDTHLGLAEGLVREAAQPKSSCEHGPRHRAVAEALDR